MKTLLLVAILLVAVATTVSSNCLLKQSGRSTNLCLLEENLADETFLQQLCNGENGELSIISEYRSEFESSRKFSDYCKHGALGRFNWIKNKDILEKLLNSKKVNVDLPRVTRAVDSTNQGYSLTTDYTADDVEVLIEKLPIRYELRDIERTKWKNVTEIQSVTISKEHLKNTDRKSSRLISKEVQYTSNHVVEYIYPLNLVNTREVRIFNADNTVTRVNTFAQPIATPQYKTFLIERRVGPDTVVNSKVIGTLAKSVFYIEGNLTKVYDDDEREEVKLRMQVIETDLVDVHAEDYNINGRGIISEYQFTGPEQGGSSAFEIWVIIAFCIFFGTIIVAATDVSLKILRGKRRKYHESLLK